MELLFVQKAKITTDCDSKSTGNHFFRHTVDDKTPRARQIMFSEFIQSIATKPVIDNKDLRDRRKSRELARRACETMGSTCNDDIQQLSPNSHTVTDSYSVILS